MKTIRFLLAAIALALAAPLFAHPGHNQPINRDEAIQRANSEVERLVSSGKLEKTWKAGEVREAKTRAVGKEKEWVVSIGNAKAADPDKNVLYVFLSDTGEYLAANFTGK